MQVKNEAQLITYPDSLGGDLASLGGVLDASFAGLFAGIHILPPFPSSGDRGFSPRTYDEIDPRFGSWADIRRLSERFDIELDMIVNHVSRESAYFTDFLRHGRKSQWADLFIQLDKIWPNGVPVQADVDRLFLRRPKPWSTYMVGSPPEPVEVWTTFGREDPSDQIDMDWRSPAFRSIVEANFDRFAANGVKIVRLDALGFLAKRAGTSCFFLRPEMDEVLGWLDGEAARRDLALLPEVHGPEEIQRALVDRGSWIYDFVLPYRILEALILRSPAALARYLAYRPGRVFTMLDCHDGVPVKPDLDGQYDSARVRRVVATCLERGGNLSLLFSPRHHDPDGLDVHQIRGTYYSLLGSDDDAYIAARAIQLFAPGVPQIYYVGLLAGENDQAAGAATGEGREINRHNYSLDEIHRAREREVVRRLVRLIELRNSHPAFGGYFVVENATGSSLRVGWQSGWASAELEVDFATYRCLVTTSNLHGLETLEL